MIFFFQKKNVKTDNQLNYSIIQDNFNIPRLITEGID